MSEEHHISYEPEITTEISQEVHYRAGKDSQVESPLNTQYWKAWCKSVGVVYSTLLESVIVIYSPMPRSNRVTKYEHRLQIDN